VIGGNGGGGGGGYYGGGGGGGGGANSNADNTDGAGGGGGGGGSDYTGAATHVTVTDGYQSGHGQVTISYTVLTVTTTSLPAATGGTPTARRWPQRAGSRRTPGRSRPGRCRLGFP
jgi:hypothetical protein